MDIKPVTHVIFGCDGVLLDTSRLHMEIINRILATLEKPDVSDVTRFKMLGRTELEAMQVLRDDMRLQVTVEELRERFVAHFKEFLPRCSLMLGATELVRHLSMNEIPMAVATSSSAEGMEAKTKNHRHIFDLFSHVVMGSSDKDVKYGKPDPDIFLICASRFPDKPPPEQCLVFEDTPNGIAAAKAAGMQVVLIPDPQMDRKLWRNATMVLKTLKNFLPENFGLPAFCECAPK